MSDPADASVSALSLRRFAGNAAWLMTGELVAKVASFLFIVIVARGLGAAQYGYFTFAISFMPLFLMLGSEGIEAMLVREIVRAKTRLSELFATGLVLRFALGFVALSGSVLLARFLIPETSAFQAVALLGTALFCDQLSAYFGTVFKAFERMGFPALVLVINRLLSTALAALALATGGGLRLVAATYLVGSAAALAFGVVAVRRWFPPIRLRDASRALMLALFKRNALFALAGWLNMAVFRLDAVLLQILRGPVAVAMYGVAYRFFESLLFVGWHLSTASLPRMSDANEPRSAIRTFDLSAPLVFSFYLPVAVGSLFAGHWLVVTLFTRRYEKAAAVVTLLAASGIFYGLAILARTALFTLDRVRAIAWVAGIALAVNLSLNLMLIPRYSFVGAGVANLLTEVVEAAALVGLLIRSQGGFNVRRLLVPTAAACAMGGILLLTGFRDLRALVAGSLTYLLALGVAARVLVPQDFRRAIDLLRRRVRPVPTPTA